ncbi:MAG: YihY/virulence factor BrkB family protein [Bacteroidaceae bacterium]|nr:YihY/virulence factor BrkB family protein [Bacteroidaceae bacterium]
MADKKESKLKALINRITVFVSKDIWSFELYQKGPLRRAIANTVKVVVIAVRTFLDDKVMTKAAALTYSTLFAIVPILALIFAVARGFGFENIVTGLLKNGIIGENESLNSVMQFIDGYMQYVSSGAFIGIGLLFLLFSVYSLADGIEANLNSIWHVKKSRRMGRKITDYFSLILLIPIGIICLCGMSMLASSVLSHMEGFQLLGGFAKFIIEDALPYVIAGFILTGFYIFMPNTKVRFKYAIIPGIIAGCLFQALQNLYFDGQFSLSSYNAIYGGFAALPLFLLWLNVSWAIILFGCELAYVSQNNDNFNYFKEPDKISRRHEDFYSLMVMACICKRFNRHETALTRKELADELHIPLRYVVSSLDTLIDSGLLETVLQNDEREPAYVPATDTGQLTVVKVLYAINNSGYCDLDHALDSKIREALLKIDNERKSLSGDIWSTPLIDL